MKRGLTFDEVILVPKYNNIPSRSEPSLQTNLTSSIKIDLPFINSPMDSVISADLAKVMFRNGMMPLFCRTKNLPALANDYTGLCFVSVGLGDYGILESYLDFFSDRVRGVCVDIAHGHSPTMVDNVKYIKDIYPKLQVIAGAVATSVGYRDLVHAGADAVRVGIGSGAACSTRMVTGFGVPQFQAIKDIAVAARELKVPFISDGGCRSPADIAKALAAGASSVMLGSMFAATEESGAKKNKTLGARYRGQASKEYQIDNYGGLREGTVAEGVGGWIPVTGSAQDLLNELTGSLRSAFTYGGSRDIREFWLKSEFMQVSDGSFLEESNPRIS